VIREEQLKMKKCFLLVGAAAGALTLVSCDTPVGQGAGYGAAGGAIIGGLAGGTTRNAAIGAAAGAGLGALIGAIVQDSQRDRYYRDAPSGGYPMARETQYPGIVRSPYYPYHLIDVSRIPPGALVIDPSVDRPFVRP
jgi:Glycine zipper